MTTRNWLVDAHTDLAGADDRVAVSETRIAALLTTALDPVDLPEQWAIDRGLLPKPVAAKLARRDAEGLPVPLHAHGASKIAVATPEEWVRVCRDHKNWVRMQSQLPGQPVPREPRRDQPFDGRITRRQIDALRTNLPHTTTTADRTSTRPGSMGAGKVLDALYLGGRSLTLSRVFLLVAMGITIFELTVGTFGSPDSLLAPAGLAALACLFQAAHTRGFLADDVTLNGTEWRALEQATVAEPGPEPGTPEYRLAQIAVALSEQITGCPAWSSDTLAVHRIQLDPAAEAAQITVHAAEISRVRVTLGPDPVGDSDAAARAREQRAGNQQILDAVLVSPPCTGTPASCTPSTRTTSHSSPSNGPSWRTANSKP